MVVIDCEMWHVGCPYGRIRTGTTLNDIIIARTRARGQATRPASDGQTEKNVIFLLVPLLSLYYKHRPTGTGTGTGTES
jgi:hypothetical protein